MVWTQCIWLIYWCNSLSGESLANNGYSNTVQAGPGTDGEVTTKEPSRVDENKARKARKQAGKHGRER